MNRWRDHEAFRSMDPRKQTYIEQLAAALDGKKLTEALPLLTNWKKELRREGITFSEQENQLLTALFSAQLTPQQQKQFDILKTYMNRSSQNSRHP